MVPPTTMEAVSLENMYDVLMTLLWEIGLGLLPGKDSPRMGELWYKIYGG